jgi:hypothetical protein
MAVKKTAKKKEASAAPTKVEAKEAAPKKAPKKAAAKAPAAEPVPTAVETPPPAPTPEPAAKKAAPKKAAAAKKAAAPKKAAPALIKLSASQDELLKKIGGTAETGYSVAKKIEQRSVDALLEKKLIKKGAKDKATGLIKYHISSAGKKHTS